jgi:hypothetical protein
MHAKSIASRFVTACVDLGWTYSTHGSVVCIEKRFSPNDKMGFIQADSEYFDLLDIVPQTSPGSIWGTDGSGIGGDTAMSTGHFKMKKSGCSKRVLAAINKLAG